MSQILIDPNTANYPPHLQQRLGQDAPLLTVKGPTDWLAEIAHPKIGIFSSVKAPARRILQAHELAQQWRTQPLTIISGFQSPLEEEVWSVLVQDVINFQNLPPEQNSPRLVKVLARSMIARLSAREHHAIAIGDLALVSPFPENIKRATKETAFQRNLVTAALADTIIIAHAEDGGRTAQLAQRVRAWDMAILSLSSATARRV